MKSVEFWELVRKRRNHFYYTWMGWLIAGPLLGSILSKIPGIDQSLAAIPLPLLIWSIFWLFIYFRLINLTCYKCGEKAISHAMFIMKFVKCKNCGVRPNET